MFTLPTKDIKAFFAASSFVTQNNILPILSYIHISFDTEKAVMHRTNNRCHYFHEVDCKNKPGELLVEQYILQNFVNNTRTDSVTFIPKGDNITITNGQYKISAKIMDGAAFPQKPDEFEGDTIEIGQDLMGSLKLATNFLDSDFTPGQKNHVFLGNNHVCAGDGNIGCFTKLNKVPFHSPLYQTIIDALPLADCAFKQNDRWFQFKAKGTEYLFIKPEIGFFDMTGVAVLPERTGSVDKEDFMEFLKLARSECKSKLCLATIKGTDKGFVCESADYDYETSLTGKPMAYEGKEFDFFFNVDYMIKLVKQVEGETLELYIGTNDRLYITGENKSPIFLIMKVKILQK